MSDSGDSHALVGPYLVDAVTDHERAEFEAHLATCDDCQREVRSLRDVIATMADAEAAAPPAGLRERVLAQANTTPQLPPTTQLPHASHEPSKGERRGARRATWPRVTAVAAAVLAIAAVGIGAILATGTEPDAVALERDVMMVASAPDATSMDLELGSAHLVVSERMASVAAMGYGAPMPTKGMEYQLWLVMDDGAAHPGPTFMPAADGDFMALMHTDLAGVTGFWVTEEPMGGSPQPTAAPLASVER